MATHHVPLLLILGVGLGLAAASVAPARSVPVDLPGDPAEGGVSVRREGDGLEVAWPVEGGEFGRLRFDLRPGSPLITSLGLAPGAEGPAATLLRDVDPLT